VTKHSSGLIVDKVRLRENERFTVDPKAWLVLWGTDIYPMAGGKLYIFTKKYLCGKNMFVARRCSKNYVLISKVVKQTSE